MKTPKIWAVLICLGLTVSFAYYRISRTPRTETHLHGDEAVEDHSHTHTGPFSHDHYHVGLTDGTTHSHPHQHPDDHLPVLPKDLEDWITIGHQHNDEDTVTIYLARATLVENDLKIEFKKLNNNKHQPCLPDANRLAGKIYIGHDEIDELLFNSESGLLINKNCKKGIANPNATLVFTDVQIDSHRMDSVILPIDLVR